MWHWITLDCPRKTRYVFVPPLGDVSVLIGAILSATVTKRASKSETGSQDSPAVHQSPSENLQSQLWCWLETGQLCSVTGSVLAVSKHKTAGSTVQLRLLEAQNDGVVDQWQIDGDGAIMCGDNMVLDAKSTSGSGPDELSVQTRRTYACSSQRWVVIPRPSPRGAFVPPRPVRTFKLISTSGKALDACSDGRLTTFEPHPGAETQRWRFICGPHGFYLENDHAKLVATLHWVEVGDGDGQLSAVRLSSRSAALYDRQLWSFDSKGFLVSRHSGRVLDSLSNQEGGPVDATARRTNVAGLGLLFKNFSTESQRWHVVPESRGSEATTDVEESLLESEASMILPSPSDFLDAALAELDEFGAGLRNTSLRCASPDGCDQALEALDDIANQLNQGTRRTSTSSLGSQDNPTPPRTPLPALRRDVSSDELWEKLVLPAEQNAALTQITEQIWTSLESDRGARLDGDQLK